MATFVDRDSMCGDLREGDVITHASGFSIGNSEDFTNALSSVKKDDYVTMVINDGPGGCTAIEDGNLGINVADIPSDELKFSLDIQGGTVFLFKPSTNNLERINQIINKRIKIFNVPETKAYVSNDTIKIVSLAKEKISSLTIPGEFEAKILEAVKIENGTGEIKIENNVYPVKLIDNKIEINNSSQDINQTFSLEQIDFKLLNITNDSVVVEATIFTNEDVLKVLTRYSYTKELAPQTYEFNIPLEISDQASNKFTRIAKGLEITFSRGEQILEGFLVYYLDGKMIGELNIPVEIAEKEIKTIAVIGFGENHAEISEEKLKVQAVLESGKLPDLELIGTESYEPYLRENVIRLVLISTVLIIISVIVLAYIRYKHIALGFYMISVVASEVVCIFGFVALTQKVLAYGWIFGFPSIVGLIVFIIISTVWMFLVTEYKTREKELSLWYKHRKILSLKKFLIMTASITSFILLFTVWKGFGLSIISGLILGLLVTKSLYEQIISHKVL